MRLILFGLISGILFLPALSQESQAPHAEEKITGIDLALISEVSAVAPATPFTVAFSIRHHDGFHTYWRNPGIVGVPFTVQWDLPEGFTAGEIQWPVPEQISMAGHPAHGQTRDVLLLVEITPPDKLPTHHITLSAAANWMACAEGCFPGNRTLSLVLPRAEKSATPSEHAGSIKAAREKLPRPLEGWSIALESEKDAPEIVARFRRDHATASDPGRIYFYSSDGQISSDPPQTIEPLADGFRLLAPRAKYSPEGCLTLPGVVVAEKPWGEGQGKAVTVEPAYP